MKAHDGKIGKYAFPARFQRAEDQNEPLSENTLENFHREEARIYQSEQTKLHGKKNLENPMCLKIQSSFDTIKEICVLSP